MASFSVNPNDYSAPEPMINSNNYPKTEPPEATKLTFVDAALQYIKLVDNIVDETEALKFLDLVEDWMPMKRKQVKKKEIKRREALVANISNDPHDPRKKKFQKCLSRYRILVSRCKSLKRHEPNLKWESIEKIEKELEGYQTIEQFDQFWKRLVEMESFISRLEFRIHFGFLLALKKPFVSAKTCICNCLKRVSSQ
ncbi:hypothetical protein GCK72_017023 [Caenorhabditis remanei]|uniref:Uncharacterized protein n=1 Tax=Caenorhabditis remanei TaxID=31234 RepID=A0A6A5G6R1_CAERE|nr:hypothetical protein GCK72_017023 [Caenorhabditis remanei]KAF1750473.1 hypothetical protein GCK72_017023 [Caenorhabditis remanei]